MIGQSAGKSFAYLLGVYLGDGCITAARDGKKRFWRNVFRLNTIDADFASATKGALHDLGCETVIVNRHPVSKSTRANHALWATPSVELLDAMMEITDRKQKLPDDVLEWPRECRVALIVGLMDSEGFVAANHNPTNRRYYLGFKSCDAWVPDFIKVLESVGVKVGKVQVERPRLPHYRAPTRFTIKMQSWIDAGCRFNIARKQQRVDEWAEFGPLVQKKQRRLASETNMRNVAPATMIEPDLSGDRQRKRREASSRRGSGQ